MEYFAAKMVETQAVVFWKPDARARKCESKTGGFNRIQGDLRSFLGYFNSSAVGIADSRLQPPFCFARPGDYGRAHYFQGCNRLVQILDQETEANCAVDFAVAQWVDFQDEFIAESTGIVKWTRSMLLGLKNNTESRVEVFQPLDMPRPNDQ
jgi:hypothetical protein